MIGRIFLCLLLSAGAFAQQVPIGQWREHLPYRQALSVIAAQGRIYCSTPYTVFAVSLEDRAISRYSKVTGLHDAGVAAMGFDAATGSLVIAYQNSNLDILRQETAVNIPDIMLRPSAGDKRIYHIACHAGKTYLSTGIGIIAADLERHEIIDTYVPSADPRVNAVAADHQYLYAATPEGVKRALQQGSNLAEPSSWEMIFAGAPVTMIAATEQQVICLRQDTLYEWKNGNWFRWYTAGRAIRDIQPTPGNSWLVCETGRVMHLSQTGEVMATIPAAQPNGAVQQDANTVWIAEAQQGLVLYSNGTKEDFTPNSPGGIVTGEMIISGETLWAAAGGVTDNWQGTGDLHGYYKFEQEEWTNYPSPDTLPDIVTLAATTDGLYAGSFGGGLLMPGGNVRKPPLLISGLAADKEGRLWMSAFGENNDLLVMKQDHTWQSFFNPIFHLSNAVSQVLVGDNHITWTVSPRGNGLFSFNYGSTLEDTQDDTWKLYRAGAGQGNLPSTDVRCIVQDQQGWIWAGTARGVAVIQCEGCDAYLPVVRQDNFAGHLFQDEVINTLAVDGANRKWVGTRNGAWLVSATGEEIIQHFNSTNSPLPDDMVHRIIVHPVTGEVFFATAGGLYSWRGMATEGTAIQGSQVLVFPNPVRPGYEGNIAIRGLVQNAIVKITDVTGKLVFQTRAQGGQAVWNGRDYTHHRPQSGIYLIFSSDGTGKEKLVAKLAFIH